MTELAEIRRVAAAAERLFSATQVHQALDTLAVEISDTLAERNPVVLAVMTGGIVPAGLLLPRLGFPLQLDYLHATRYRGETQGGRLDWVMRGSIPLSGRCVLLVDDIHDEGVTLEAIRCFCLEQGAAAVYSVVLVNKYHGRKTGQPPDFVALEVPDRYVFGFGMDYKGYLRNAAGIFALA